MRAGPLMVTKGLPQKLSQSVGEVDVGGTLIQRSKALWARGRRPRHGPLAADHGRAPNLRTGSTRRFLPQELFTGWVKLADACRNVSLVAAETTGFAQTEVARNLLLFRRGRFARCQARSLP